MNKLLTFLKKFLNIKCSHSAAIIQNCKYCPDCGKKIVPEWIIIKCKSCGHYREPSINYSDEIKPLKKYCFYCGSSEWTTQSYYEPNIPDSMKSISIKRNRAEERYTSNFGNLTTKTKIWVSNSHDEKIN